MNSEFVNKLICGDNLEELVKLPKESVDLIYIDPPFFTHKQYEVVWGDEAEVRSFGDRWEGGIEHYISWMTERVQLMYDVLKPTGSFYLHCDWHANAHVRIMLDKIFGAKNFRNEIIWHYSGWNKKLRGHFERRSDTIFFYAKSKEQLFYSYSIPWKSVEEYVRIRKQKLRTDKNGRKYVLSDAGGGKRVKRYIEDAMEYGIPVDNVWDIDKLNNSSKEMLGYPTRKPEALLERIIQASSNEGDIVLDAFCGCGTACVVAHRLKRKWIGIDISPTAIKVIEQRLLRVGAQKDRDYISIGLPKTIAELKKLKPFEFQNWVINEMQGRHSRRKVGDMGIDGYIPKDLFREPSGIQVKQSEGVGRNVVDNFKSALERAKYKKGYIVAFSFGKGASEEAARLKNSGDVDIELVRVEDLLSKKITLK